MDPRLMGGPWMAILACATVRKDSELLQGGVRTRSDRRGSSSLSASFSNHLLPASLLPGLLLGTGSREAVTEPLAVQITERHEAAKAVALTPSRVANTGGLASLEASVVREDFHHTSRVPTAK